MKELIKYNRRISIKDLSSETGLSVGLCHQIVTKDLDMIRTSSKFVPRILTEEQNEVRMDVCKNMVERTRTDPEWMQKIITGEKSSLAKKLNLDTPLLLEALTDGLPNYLKKYLIAAGVKETSDWIKIATQLKYSTNQEKQEPQCKYNSDNQQPSTSNDNRQNFQTRSYYPARSRLNPNSPPSLQSQPPPRSSPRSTTAHHQEASSRTINLPPYPCKICASHQLPNQYHFHRDCPLKNNNHPKRINPESALPKVWSGADPVREWIRPAAGRQSKYPPTNQGRVGDTAMPSRQEKKPRGSLPKMTSGNFVHLP
ncbi:hypothetical protein LAZ67_1006550 [Cordylochernes scorpioides]|uniref:Uncharacterized protein n=1 Tax=Cordylochernes scorpioides TaxID=51811 RepID=A0ABY6JZ29_9ARAC|nr:hypothetical protein LAZ67_1006550 [Cordylochernes scorpioides]